MSRGLVGFLTTAGWLALATALLVGGLPSPMPAQMKSYYAGGEKPFPPELKHKLDVNADLLTLGINSEWMEQSNIEAAPFIEAITVLADSVRRGEIPGAVIYADRVATNTMPVGVGYMMTDPQRRALSADTQYDILDLTGPVVTAPLVLSSIAKGKLKPDDRLGDLVPDFAGSRREGLTVEMLLRHSSGLPSAWKEPESLKTRADAVKFLRELKSEKTPGLEVIVSPLNTILLGMVLEHVEKKRFTEIVEERLIEPFEMNPSTMQLAPEKRHAVAPGGYSAFLGRMAWAEPTDRISRALYPDTAHTGFITFSDALANELKAIVPVVSLYSLPGSEDTPMGRFFQPQAGLRGGENMAMGFAVGRLGPRSYGWDAKGGCSVWLIPEKMAFIIYLSNYDHPQGLENRRDDPRDKVLPLLDAALLPLPPPVDTSTTNAQPQSAKQEEAQPSPTQ